MSTDSALRHPRLHLALLAATLAFPAFFIACFGTFQYDGVASTIMWTFVSGGATLVAGGISSVVGVHSDQTPQSFRRLSRRRIYHAAGVLFAAYVFYLVVTHPTRGVDPEWGPTWAFHPSIWLAVFLLSFSVGSWPIRRPLGSGSSRCNEPEG